MKNLLLSSIVILCFFSCTLGHYKRLVPIGPSAASSELKPLFGDHFSSFLFKTNITLYGKNVSGLLVTKQMQPADYRVVFTTELGMKLFDFEFTDTAFTLHYCVPQFNRPSLIRTIQQDIEILLMTRISSKTIQNYSDKENQYIISKIDSGRFSDYYWRKKDDLFLTKIEHAKGKVKKTTFVLEKYADQIPTSIRIQHHDLKLNIELALLKK